MYISAGWIDKDSLSLSLSLSLRKTELTRVKESALHMGRACAKSRDSANVRPVFVTSNVLLHSRFSGKFMYTGLKQVENMYDDFVKVMPR